MIPHSAHAESIRRQFDEIAQVVQQKTGLDQIGEINHSVNALLNGTHFFLKSQETDWRSVDSILDSKYRGDCKDFVVLKEELLRRAGIKSERILVLLRNSNQLHCGIGSLVRRARHRPGQSAQRHDLHARPQRGLHCVRRRAVSRIKFQWRPAEHGFDLSQAILNVMM